MDSANSGSIQSSSGGDEEYDSRADSISALFHPISSSSSAAASLPPPPSSSSSTSIHPNPSSFFDSFSFLDHSPLLPLDSSSPWPQRPLRPTPTPDFPPLTSSLPRGPPISQSSVQQQSENSTAIAAPPRNSKKRSRASRRAPTTVLTTDTSNFRAMVQEFTGIPSPPFGAAGSPFSRSRFDLFHSSSSSSPSSLPPPYILRPFPQKPPTFVSPNPSSSSSTITAIIDALASTTNTISNAKASTTIPITSAPTSISNSTPTNNNYQLPSPDPGLASQSQSLFNLQSQGPVINFQSLLAQKYSLPTVPPAFATRPQAVIPSAEFGSGELGLPPGLMIRSEGVQSGWATASGPDGGEQARLRPVVGGNDNGAQQRVSSCKFKYSGPGSSEFNGEKGSEGVAARGEGMVDSWICSSD